MAVGAWGYLEGSIVPLGHADLDTSRAESEVREADKRKPAAVICDMDGTFFDSADVVPDACGHMVRELGGPEYRPLDIIARYHLGPPHVILTVLLRRSCRDADLETYYLNLGRQADRVLVYPGIRDCLTDLTHSHIALGVVTGANLRGSIILLQATGLSPYF